jgi:hypothetical protein
LAGNVTSTSVNGVTTTTTINSSTYYAAPSQITTNALSSTMTWSSFLGLSSATGPNGDGSLIVYDANARPSHYSPCGCSPLGKMSQTSRPYAPGGTVYWTTYTYDASGRTTKVTLPDGS